MSSHLRWLVVGSIAIATACSTSWPDPAPPNFLLGLSHSDQNVYAWIGSCAAGEARRVTVTKDASTGEVLWDIAVEANSGVGVEAIVPKRLQVGATPPGMTAVESSPESIPEDASLFITVNFSDNPGEAVGIDADLAGASDGRIVSHDRSYTVEEFGQVLARNCA